MLNILLIILKTSQFVYQLAVLTQKVKQASCVVSSGEHSLEHNLLNSLVAPRAEHTLPEN